MLSQCSISSEGVSDKISKMDLHSMSSPNYLAHTCSHCQKVVIQRPSQAEIDEAEAEDSITIVAFDGTTVSLAASHGCQFFELAVSRLRTITDSSEMGVISKDWSLRIVIHMGDLLNDSLGFDFVIAQWHHKSKTNSSIEYWFWVVAEPHDPAAYYIHMRPSTRQMLSEHTWSLVKGWLKDCESNHGRCNEVVNRKMPSRVIEISSRDGTPDPLLRIRHTPSWENYAALSYCWGNGHSTTLTQSTMEEFTKAIMFSHLPKTLRDAVLTTMKLSLRFLWVDSLCVIQDDPTDTAKEIASMPDVYRNAHITIYAARSMDCKDGFLHERSTPSTEARVFKVPFRCPDTNHGSLLLAHELHTIDPIERRGWPLQEFLLSRRVLKYGLHQLSWTCMCEEIHENKDRGVGSYADSDVEISHLRRRFLTAQEISTPTSNLWQDIVYEFSTRKVTESRDRLLAISAIATVFANMRRDLYLGGLWFSNLPLQLLWENVGANKPRPIEYRAPSWSWASVDDEVTWDYEDAFVDPYLKILSYEVMPDQPSAPYGTLKSGYIEILGNMREGIWYPDTETLATFNTEQTYWTVCLAYTSKDAVRAEDRADKGEAATYKLEDPIPVWCLQICSYDNTDDAGPIGLILVEENENENVFRRVVAFAFGAYPHPKLRETAVFLEVCLEQQKEWAESCKMRKITII